jgi:type II secretory pathway predicted ATPase ExeA
LQRLLRAIDDGEGVVVLTGSHGCGKTLLCHVLLERLGNALESAFVTHTLVPDRGALLQVLLFDLGLDHSDRSEQQMRLALIEHLLSRYRAGKRPLLVIDEAQHLSPEMLEELRLLGNLEGSRGKALQIVLIGQPELLTTLSYPALTSLRQRIITRVQLEPLGVEESADYVLHHLRAAGGRPDRILSLETLEVLARSTGGVPRLLNQATHLAMRYAVEFEASEVEVEHAIEALNHLGLSVAEPVEMNLHPKTEMETSLQHTTEMEKLSEVEIGEAEQGQESPRETRRIFLAPPRAEMRRSA